MARQTPFDLLRARESSRRLTKTQVLEITRELEDRAMADPPRLAVAVIQDVRFAGARARAVWGRLASAGCRVVVYGRDVPAYLGEGVPGTEVDDDDPLVDIWAFLVVWDDDRVAAFAAADVGPGRDDPTVADLDRDFDLARSEDCAAVHACLAELGLAPVG